MMLSHGTFLLIAALISVLALILLIAWGKINPFITIFAVSLGLAIVSGMHPAAAVKSFEKGLGDILGHIAIIIALGTMLGKMMAESGGAERIAETLIRVFGEKWIPWSMMVAAIIIGLPVFFEVGFVLLVPIVFTVARRTGKSPLLIGLPMVCGLSVVHGMVPPHPAAVIAVALYHANIGRTVFYALIVGIPVAILSGPLYGSWIAPKIHLRDSNPMADQLMGHHSDRPMPGFAITSATILLPIVLMLVGGWADAWTRPGSGINLALHFAGNADISLLLGVILSLIVLGKMRGFSRETMLRFTNECLAPTAAVTLLVGAGGGFGRILEDSGVSHAIVALALQTHVSVLVLAWLLAALIRLATGSATVAIATAASIMAPFAAPGHGVKPELLAVATGAGSLIFSHVNDGGFWLVKEYFEMSISDTLKSWSICETIISVGGLFLVLGLAAI